MIRSVLANGKIAAISALPNNEGNTFGLPPIVRNTIAFLGAEASNRVTRIIGMVFVARLLSPEMFGIAALVLTSHELLKVGTQNGIGQMIIKAKAADLEATCLRAHQLNFRICQLIAGLQIFVGAILAVAFENPSLMLMSGIMALVFLGMPFGLVRLFRAARRDDVHLMARISHRQNSADNFLMLIFAVAGFSAWALVLPKVLTMPIWVMGARASDNWKPTRSVQPLPLKEFRGFCVPIVISEFMKSCAQNVDKLLIAAILGVEALGIYFFAYNAGLGLTTTLGRAISNCLMPHLCTAKRAGKSAAAVWKGLTPTLFGGAALLFLSQAAAALFYVPIVFGEQWREYTIAVSILCLAAMPRFLTESTAQLLRSVGKANIESIINTTIASLTLIALAIGAYSGGILGAVIAITATAWIIEPALAVAGYKFSKKASS